MKARIFGTGVLFCAVVFVLSFCGCGGGGGSTPVTPTSTPNYLPLEVGNMWINAGGNTTSAGHHGSSKITSTSTSIINGKTVYVEEYNEKSYDGSSTVSTPTGQFVYYKSDGYYWEADIDGKNALKFFKEDAKVGDTWTNGDSDNTTYKVLAEETVTVPAGTFTCLKYQKTATSNKEDVIIWVADGVGLVKIYVYRNSYNGSFSGTPVIEEALYIKTSTKTYSSDYFPMGYNDTTKYYDSNLKKTSTGTWAAGKTINGVQTTQRKSAFDDGSPSEYSYWTKEDSYVKWHGSQTEGSSLYYLSSPISFPLPLADGTTFSGSGTMTQEGSSTTQSYSYSGKYEWMGETSVTAGTFKNVYKTTLELTVGSDKKTNIFYVAPNVGTIRQQWSCTTCGMPSEDWGLTYASVSGTTYGSLSKK